MQQIMQKGDKKVWKSMIPLDVVHEDLFALNLWDFDKILEYDPYFAAFSKSSVDFAFLILVTLNCNLLSDEFLNVQKLLTEKVFNN